MRSSSFLERRFKCDITDCEAHFKTKFSLKRHIKIHKFNKEHVCNKCGKDFALKQYLIEHDFIHTGQKPFVCGIDDCQKSFRQKGKRSAHQSLKHGVKLEKRRSILDEELEMLENRRIKPLFTAFPRDQDNTTSTAQIPCSEQKLQKAQTDDIYQQTTPIPQQTTFVAVHPS